MTGAYYNEFDKNAAAWLRELIKRGLLPQGDVDERDMREVRADDLRGYNQWHFFAGIGGWPHALRLAGWPDDRPVWSASPPCQPFSSAGKQLGVKDERHLAPHFLELVAAIRPPIVFGEQVAAAVKKDDWLDDLLDALEDQGYATGAIVLPACSVGAPHIRQRLWFTGRLADTTSLRLPRQRGRGAEEERGTAELFQIGRMADSDSGERSRVAEHGEHEQHGEAFRRQQGDSESSRCCPGSGMADSDSGRQQERPQCNSDKAQPGVEASPGDDSLRCGATDRTHAPATGWDDPDWLFCRDGKWRPVESESIPLTDELPRRLGYSRIGGRYVCNPLIEKAENRVMRLKGYGNAIVPAVAAEIIKCAIDGGL